MKLYVTVHMEAKLDSRAFPDGCHFESLSVVSDMLLKNGWQLRALDCAKLQSKGTLLRKQEDE